MHKNILSGSISGEGYSAGGTKTYTGLAAYSSTWAEVTVEHTNGKIVLSF